ncbi:hypothetical protein ABKN59_011597 [Abortiporus biennis]
MATRFGRVFLQVSRPSLRVQARNAGRRTMSSAHHAQKSSDTPWIIGSSLVFGPALIYLLSPSGKSKVHKTADHHAKKHEPKVYPDVAAAEATSTATTSPLKDDEGSEVSAAEVSSSLQTAYNEDSPKDAQTAEEQGATGGAALTDSDGETVSAADINASSAQAFSTDSPADAQASEEASTASSESANVETAQAEKPAGDHPGTLQGESSQGAADLGEARERAKAGQDPKTASKDQ